MKKIILLLVVTVTFTSCVLGGKAIEKAVSYQNYSYEKMFSNAKKAMWELGKVTMEDKDNGVIVGSASKTGVEITAKIIREGTSNKLKVSSVLPAGRIGVGKVKETEQFIEIFNNLQK